MEIRKIIKGFKETVERVTFKKKPISLIEYRENIESHNEKRFDWLQLFGSRIGYDYLRTQYAVDIDFYNYVGYDKKDKQKKIVYGIRAKPLLQTNREEFSENLTRISTDLKTDKLSREIKVRLYGHDKEVDQFIPEFTNALEKAAISLRKIGK